MFNLISTINVTDVDLFSERAKALPQDHLDELGVVEQSVYRAVGQNVVIISGTYNTLEEAQNHKAILESPDTAAELKQIGAESYNIWLAEKA